MASAVFALVAAVAPAWTATPGGPGGRSEQLVGASPSTWNSGPSTCSGRCGVSIADTTSSTMALQAQCARDNEPGLRSGTPTSLTEVQTNPHYKPPADGTVRASLMHHTATSDCKPWSADASTSPGEKVGGSNRGPSPSAPNKKTCDPDADDFEYDLEHGDGFFDDDAGC